MWNSHYIRWHLPCLSNYIIETSKSFIFQHESAVGMSTSHNHFDFLKCKDSAAIDWMDCILTQSDWYYSAHMSIDVQWFYYARLWWKLQFFTCWKFSLTLKSDTLEKLRLLLYTWNRSMYVPCLDIELSLHVYWPVLKMSTHQLSGLSVVCLSVCSFCKQVYIW